MKNWIEHLLLRTSDDWLTQLFRYAIVGGVSFVVDYGLLYLLTERVGLHYILSATISFITGLIVNYLISIHWVFRTHKLQNRTTEFLLYAIIGIVGLFFNNLLLYVFTDCVQLHYLISKLVAAAIVLIWNFVGRKWILFR